MSQKLSDFGTAYHRITFESNDTLFQFYVTSFDKRFKAKDDREYFWYGSNAIIRTFGDHGDKLLDGLFIKYYPNGNLAVKEFFLKGLRNGDSKMWYPDGKLMSVIQWIDGKKDGNFKEYDSLENLIRYGKYQDDKLNGTIYCRSTDGLIKKLKYKHGELRVYKIEKVSESNNEEEKIDN
jgi:antitoxin component YwqK of YwqJK toxin-antitoxin module